jgi:hypothetical protein
VATCSFVRPNRQRCRANVHAEGDLCLFHDQARSRQAHQARSKGAATTNARKAVVRVVEPSALPGPLSSVEDASRWASWITTATATGQIDARTAHEMSFSLRLFIDARRSADQTDERVRQLEAKLRQLEAKRGR